MLKETPIYDRPREKAKKYGIDTLSNVELIAIILRTGTKNNDVIHLSREILSNISCLRDLTEYSLSELLELNGIGYTKAITLLAAIELGKRINEPIIDEINFSSPTDVYNYMSKKVIGLKEENFYVIYLNAKGAHIATKLISTGGLNATIFDPRVILKWAFKLSSFAFILVHNHPSGDPTPSVQDVKYTKQIVELSKINGFMVLDHIIIGNYAFSMKKEFKNSNLF